MSDSRTLPSRTSAAVRIPAVRDLAVEAWNALALAGLAAAVLWWRWVSYQGHDDAYYAAAALEWVERFPALGENHWALRYPLVLPTAALIAVFGLSVPILAAVNVMAYAAFLVAGYAAARHWFSWHTAAALTLIGVLVPQFPVQATYANPDLLEMALVMASFWLVMLARERGGPWPLMLGAGLLAGTGFLTRETTLLLVPLFGLMFVARPAMARWRYLLIGVGFAAVVGAQMGYFAIEAGDPLYRLRISATHDVVDRAGLTARTAGPLDNQGVLATGMVAAPFVALFVSQKFGLLFYLAIPAYFAVRRAPWLGPPARSVLDWSALGALVSFLFAALNVEILYIVPRYFMVTAAMAAVPVAVAAAHLLRWRPRLTGVAGAGFAASCLALLYLENTQPMFAEQRATDFAAAQHGTARHGIRGPGYGMAHAGAVAGTWFGGSRGERRATTGGAGGRQAWRGPSLPARAGLPPCCGDAALLVWSRLVRDCATRPAAPVAGHPAAQSGPSASHHARHLPQDRAARRWAGGVSNAGVTQPD